MKKSKQNKLIILFIAAVLTIQFCFSATIIITAAPSVSARNVSSFHDVSKNDWYYDYVKRLYEDFIINGVSDNSYAPNAEVKTSEVAAMIARYLGLENAAERNRENLIRNNLDGSKLWYSGYIQLLCDTGIFNEYEIATYNLKMYSDKSVIISGEAAALIDSPIKRMDVVKFIARSFEIKKGGTQTNRLKSEISGNGNEFILGGGYNRETLEEIQDMISDYSDIPEEYREYFLKCYYNGIVRGNEYSQVLPHNNLKRGEFAKIIATVLYFDLRESDLRNIPSACVITQSDYSVSSVDGSRFLKKEKAERILKEQAKSLKAVENKENNSVKITVTQENIIPKGYISEIYVYMYDGGATSTVGVMNCSTNTDEYFPKQMGFNISKSNAKSSGDFIGYVYYVLRDLNRNGEIAGAVMYNIDAQGNLKDTAVYNSLR